MGYRRPVNFVVCALLAVTRTTSLFLIARPRGHKTLPKTKLLSAKKYTKSTRRMNGYLYVRLEGSEDA